MHEQLKIISGQIISIQYHNHEENFYIFKIQTQNGPLTIGTWCYLAPGCQIMMAAIQPTMFMANSSRHSPLITSHHLNRESSVSGIRPHQRHWR